VGTQGGWWQQLYPPQLLFRGVAELMGGDIQSAGQVHLRELLAVGQTSLCRNPAGV
jgi:hypothetical protein